MFIINKLLIENLVSPVTHKPLIEANDCLITGDGLESYPIVENVPVLLENNVIADWHRELMEVLLWQYRDKLTEMYAHIDWSKMPTDTYIECIKHVLKDKEGIISAINEYSASKTDKWIIQNKKNTFNIPAEELKNFKKHTAAKWGKTRVKSSRNNGENGWAQYLPYYKEQVHASSPKTIVEISTGAGFGTSAIADTKSKDVLIFTVDIGFACHGNVISIAKYLGVRDSLFPVCANFWSLPFADNSIDVVCSNFGLDESRENYKTISEVARILKSGGRFINVSRLNAFLRQFNILEPFGFNKEESIDLLKKARLYSDVSDLINLCNSYGLILEERKDFIPSVKYDISTTVFVKK